MPHMGSFAVLVSVIERGDVPVDGQCECIHQGQRSRQATAPPSQLKALEGYRILQTLRECARRRGFADVQRLCRGGLRGLPAAGWRVRHGAHVGLSSTHN